MKQTPKSDGKVLFSLRLSKDLHVWIKQQAEKHHRTLSAQVAAMLQMLKDTKDLWLKPTVPVVNDLGITSQVDPGEPKNSL